jgi:hypothetical protein
MSEDVETTIAAAVIDDLLCRLPPDKRATALAKAAKAEETQRKEREKRGGRLLISATELQSQCEGLQRYWHEIKQFKAAVAYTFIRDITNSHNAEDAARLLFDRRHQGPGSGYLLDYLRSLPRWPRTSRRREIRTIEPRHGLGR